MITTFDNKASGSKSHTAAAQIRKLL